MAKSGRNDGKRSASAPKLAARFLGAVRNASNSNASQVNGSSTATATKPAIRIAAMAVAIIFAAAGILYTALMCMSCSKVADEPVEPFESSTVKRMENLDRGLVAVNGGWDNTYLSWRLLGYESMENQAFDIYCNGKKVHTTGPHDATQWNHYGNPPKDATYQVVPAGADPNDANVKKINKPVKTLNSAKGGSGYVDILFDMPPDDIQQTSEQTYKLDSSGQKIPVMVTDPDTGVESQLEIEDPVTHNMVKQYETVSKTDANGDIILTDRLDDSGNRIRCKYGVDDITTGDLDGDGEYELVVMFYASTQHSWPGYSSPVIIRGIDVDWTTGENRTLWEINCGRNICAGTHYNPILVYDFDGDGKAEMFMKTAPGVYTVDKNNSAVKHYVSEAGSGKYSEFSWDYETHTGSRTLYDVKDIDNSRYYGNPDWGCWSGPELLTVFNGETGMAMQTIGYEADWNIPPKWTGGRDEGLPRWGDYCGNRSERFLGTVAYLDGEHPSAVMTRGLYSYVYLTAYDWDGENINQLWLSENNWVGGDDGASDVREGIVIGNNVVWYGNDRYNYDPDSRPHKTGTMTAHGQGNHSLGATDFDNDGKHEIVYGSAVIDDNGLVLATTGRGHGDAHHINDFNNDGKIEIFTVHEQGPGVDLIQYSDKSAQGYRDLYWSGWAGWDIGRGMAGNLHDAYALEYNDPAVFYSIMNGSLYSAKDGSELKGFRAKDSDLPAALAPDSNRARCMDFTVYWDGNLDVELLDIAGSNGTPFLAHHYIDYITPDDWDIVEENGLKGQTNRITFGNHLQTTVPDVGTNNGSKGVPALTADILGDWREEMLFRLNDLNGDGYCDGIRLYMTGDHTEFRLYTLMHDSQYRCQVSSENVGYNQPPHTSYYIGSLARAKDEEGNLLNYLLPNRRFDKVICA
ncbi:MAG: hypothetical protein NC184_02735 [Roseburia sp.]|nr:hypothetical protein [Roseburia sp.]